MKAILIVCVSALLVLLPADTHATNGYFTHGCGTQHKALAGAGVAQPLSALSAAKNPAMLANTGTRYDLGLAVFSPNREYTVSGNPSGQDGTFGLAPGTFESGSNVFPLPSLGANWALQSGGAFGLGIYGNGGMNTDYDTPTFGFAPTGVDMGQIFVTPTYAHQFAGRHSVGVSGIFAMQYFEANGMQAFGQFSGRPENVSNNGREWSYGYGARLGYLGALTDQVRIGASFQTRLRMSEFDQYSGLFAEAGGFDIPMNWIVGLAVEPAERWTLLLDYERFHYSDVNSVGNAFLPNFMQAPLGSDDGAGFGWQDMSVVKGGVQFEPASDWALRAGYSYGEQPITSSEVLFNIVAPGVIEQHLSAGLSKTFARHSQLHLAVTRAIQQDVTGANPLEMPDQQTIQLSMNQWDVEIGYSFVP